jgi:hypothetical protein
VVFFIIGFVYSSGMCKMCKMCRMCKCFMKCAKCANSIHFSSKIPSRVCGAVRIEAHRCLCLDLNKVSVVFFSRLLASQRPQIMCKMCSLRKLHILHIFAHFAHFHCGVSANVAGFAGVWIRVDDSMESSFLGSGNIERGILNRCLGC